MYCGYWVELWLVDAWQGSSGCCKAAEQPCSYLSESSQIRRGDHYLSYLTKFPWFMGSIVSVLCLSLNRVECYDYGHASAEYWFCRSKSSEALTRAHIKHFANIAFRLAVINLQFVIYICFFAVAEGKPSVLWRCWLGGRRASGL